MSRIDSFVFYTSWLEAIESLEEKDQLEAFKAILHYQAYHETRKVKGPANAIFTMAKPAADKIYSRRKASIENGQKGGRPKTTQSAETEDKVDGRTEPKRNLEKPSKNLEETKKKPKQNLNVNVNVNDNVNVNVNTKTVYGEYQHVKLTEEQRQKLEAEYGIRANDYIKYLDEYIEMKGYKAKNHYLAIKKWVVLAVEEKQRREANLQYQNHKAEPDNVPVYDDSKNPSLDLERFNEILKKRNQEEQDGQPNADRA